MKCIKLILLMSALILVIGCNSVTTAKSLDEFATCLSEKGAELYGASWCGHCNDQKKMFGESFVKVNYVECPENQQTCSKAEIQGYPTWKFEDGTSLAGTQSFTALAVKTGCKMP